MEGELQVTVGRRVRRLRLERGISQEALARDVDMHRTYLGGVERGERNLTLRSVERLADRLGVPVRELIGEAPEG
ncbi:MULTISPECIES: helix-turn-helix domain-containing protein [Micrococcales]|uniref:helix-turn-helix domain-containing protein n=1 Tax=Micrococcales TaxID=85006 RepID=UPI001EF31416|nr:MULTISPECIES: helix-turn-helix transcriptional regulator [Micrococcales]MCG7287606.1 helix-turn-helix transcriptional regulator [Cellulomonas sp. ACRRI]